MVKLSIWLKPYWKKSYNITHNSKSVAAQLNFKTEGEMNRQWPLKADGLIHRQG